MSCKPGTGGNSKNMAVSYSNGFHSGRPRLPSFQELLPQHLHDEIDSVSYYPSRSHYQQGSPEVAAPRELISTPRCIPLDDHSCWERKTGRGGLGDSPLAQQRLSRRQTSSQSGHLSAQFQPSDTVSSSMSLSPSPSFSFTGPGHILPPIRDLGSLTHQNSGSCASRVNSPRSSRGFSPEYGNGHGHDPEDFVSRNPSSGRAAVALSAGTGQPLSPIDAAGSGQISYSDSRYASHPIPYRGDLDYQARGVHSPHHPPFGDSVDLRNKRRRGNLPKPVTEILRAWFHDHLDHPYPTEEDKQMFMTRTGLTISQISNWFINARRRQLPALRNQARVSEQEREAHRQFSPISDNERPSSQVSSRSSSYSRSRQT